MPALLIVLVALGVCLVAIGWHARSGEPDAALIMLLIGFFTMLFLIVAAGILSDIHYTYIVPQTQAQQETQDDA